MIALLTATVPHLGGGGDPAISFVRVALALAACIGIAAAAVLLVRHRTGRPLAFTLPRMMPTARRIAVIETRRISPHADICLIEHDARSWLLVVQPSGVHVLHEAAVPPSCD